MHLTHLSLTNFRNYARLELSLPPRIIVLQGANAQGKTNLLEAVYYLATARSPQTTTDRELINWLADDEPLPYARLVGDVRRGDATHRIEITLVKQPNAGPNGFRLRKQVRLNGISKRALDLLGQMPVVLFRPQDIELVAGSPGARRRYLDVTLCQIDHRYARALLQYNRVLTQRNALLRELRERHGNWDQLLFWDQKLVENGAYLLARRQALIADILIRTQPLHLSLTDGLDRLHLSYVPSFDLSHVSQTDYQLPLAFDEPTVETEQSAKDIAEAFTSQLRETRREEIARGMTVVGPHRDDLNITVNGVDLRTYGSRGQQRTAVLALKLAEVQVIQTAMKEPPILLLDEVMAELDGARRRCLMDTVEGSHQALMTSTDWDVYAAKFLTRTLRLTVCEGRIEPAGTLTQAADGTP
ncbi:MAG: DNA replication/repair protein RecF [Chloroflexota bacterium]|nr:DNA replication/repair protein RecF [Chloroflexota bacterium]